MKSTKKILSLLLVLVMVVGVFAGCSSKKKDPAELFVNALNMYRDKVTEHEAVKVLEQAVAGGSVSAKVETGEADEKITVDATVYLNKAGNAASLVLDADVAGQKVDAQFALNNKKVVLGTSLLKDKYGLDLEKAKDNFPTSLFGTKGANMFELSEEDEAELVKALEEVAQVMNKEVKDVDAYQVLMDAFKANATFTADTKTPVTIDGKEVKNTTVTATLTKNNVKSIVNKLVAELDAQELVDEMLDTMNENFKTEAEWSGETAKHYENLNALVDEAFEGKGDEDVVLTMKMVLDTKYDAIMIFEVTAEETIKFELGADPKNVSKVTVSYPAEKYVEGSDEPITETRTATLEIKKSNTSSEYILLNDKNEGLTLVINKAHKTITFTEIVDGKVNADEAVSVKYDLTAEKLSITVEEDGMNLTLTFTAKAESPVKFDDYKDLLTMTEEDFQKLMEELKPLLGGDEPAEPDVEFPEDTSEDGTETVEPEVEE